MPQLDPTWFASQIFWLAITYGLLYVLLAKVVLPPLLRIITQREERIAADLELAESLKHESEHARDQYERALADARLRSQQVFADAQLIIKSRIDEANAEMDRAVAKQVAQAHTAIEAKKQEVFTQLLHDGPELVSAIVQKITKHAPDVSKVNAALESSKRLS